MNKHSLFTLLSLGFALTAQGASWLDDVAVTVTSEGYDVKKIRETLNDNLSYNEAYLKELKEEKKHKHGFLGALSRAAINAEEHAAKVERRMIKRARYTLLDVAPKNTQLKDKLANLFKDITVAHAHIKQLEDDKTTASTIKSMGVRSALEAKRTYCLAYLER